MMEACGVVLRATVACTPLVDMAEEGRIHLDRACVDDVETLGFKVQVHLCGKQGDGRAKHVLDVDMANHGSAPSSSCGATVACQDGGLDTSEVLKEGIINQVGGLEVHEDEVIQHEDSLDDDCLLDS